MFTEDVVSVFTPGIITTALLQPRSEELEVEVGPRVLYIDCPSARSHGECSE